MSHKKTDAEKLVTRRTYYTANHDTILVKAKAYYAANREVKKKDARRMYYINRTEELVRNKAYYRLHRKDVIQQKVNYNRQQTYGISEAQFNRMCDLQGFTCAICDDVIEDAKTCKAQTLHIDHNHATGTIRKLLCKKCNSGLGYFKDSAALLRKAASYLDHFTFIEQTERI